MKFIVIETGADGIDFVWRQTASSRLDFVFRHFIWTWYDVDYHVRGLDRYIATYHPEWTIHLTNPHKKLPIYLMLLISVASNLDAFLACLADAGLFLMRDDGNPFWNFLVEKYLEP